MPVCSAASVATGVVLRVWQRRALMRAGTRARGSWADAIGPNCAPVVATNAHCPVII